MRLIKKYSKYFPFILVLLYIFITTYKLAALAVQYDEIPHVNAAIGGVDSTFITVKYGKIPILLMPYIGAVKSYIAAPVFAFFDVNPYSIRIPFVLICALSLFILYKALVAHFDKPIALLTLGLLIFDSSFVSQTRVDMGPLVVPFFCMVTSLFLFVCYLKYKRSIYVILLFIILGIGLFHKLNFIWFINSFIFSTLVVYYKDILQIWKRLELSRKVFVLIFPALSILSFLGYYLFLGKRYHLTDSIIPKNWGLRFETVKRGISVLVDGTSFYEYALGSIRGSITNVYLIFIIVILLIGTLLTFIRFKQLDDNFRKSYLFIFCITCTLIAQIFVTAQAGANWHLFSLYPFITILIANSIISIYDLLSGVKVVNKFKIQTAFIVLIMLFIISYQAWLYSKYIKAYTQPPKNITWSSEIYNLIDYTKNSPHRFASVDWGTHNQLIVFNPVKGKYIELAAVFATPNLTKENKDWINTEFFTPENNYEFITKTYEYSVFPESTSTFLEIAKEYNVNLVKVKEFKDSDMRIVFEIYIPELKSNDKEST